MLSRTRQWLSQLRYKAGMRAQQGRQAAELRSAVRAARESLKLVVGASGTGFAGWISTEYPLVDIANQKSLRRFFAAQSARAVLAEHVLEHLTIEQAAAAANNLFWLLAPGGYARIAVPDALHPDPAYIEYSRPGGSGMGSDDHKVFYDYRSLGKLFGEAGFEIRFLEWFDEAGIFHAKAWEPADGMIVRSTRFDDRNRECPTAYTSLIIDAVKPKTS
jgi:predicted SAM-dependent methyltransferase